MISKFYIDRDVNAMEWVFSRYSLRKTFYTHFFLLFDLHTMVFIQWELQNLQRGFMQPGR
jgi:hypothetical protein